MTHLSYPPSAHCTPRVQLNQRKSKRTHSFITRAIHLQRFRDFRPRISSLNPKSTSIRAPVPEECGSNPNRLQIAFRNKKAYVFPSAPSNRQAIKMKKKLINSRSHFFLPRTQGKTIHITKGIFAHEIPPRH